MNSILKELQNEINMEMWKNLHKFTSFIIIADAKISIQFEEIVRNLNPNVNVKRYCSIDDNRCDISPEDHIFIIEKEFVHTVLMYLDYENTYFYLPETFNSVYRFYKLCESHSEIEELMQMLEDEISVITLKNILKARITGDMSFIDKIQDKDTENEYVDPSIIALSENEYILDAGAYIGDSFLRFIKYTGYQFAEAYLFEPDPHNYKALQEQINTQILLYGSEGKISYKKLSKYAAQRIHLYNEGLYSHSTKLKFSSNIGVASHISGNIPMEVDEKNDQEISVTGIDEWVGDKKISVIKMDIEGAEMDALEGAQNTIKKFLPNLVICIYHKENDLWEIPLYIKNLSSHYKFYIRHYNSNLWDTVLYAIQGGE